ncbi:hypothetical protein GOBAR_DD32787 [Gossypium barbadense]|nr:hypothetical protein GOBAR_DD32787 [Gossypium barbadense]
MEKRSLKQFREAYGKPSSKKKRARDSSRELIENSPNRTVRGGWQLALPRSMKFLCWNCRGLGNPATVRELKQLLVANNLDIIFLSETKMKANDFQRVQNRCKMENGLAVSFEGKSGGLTLIWRECVDVNIQNYSKFRIDTLVRYENNKSVHFTSFYGNVNSSLRNSSWEMLRRIGETAGKGWFTWVKNRDGNTMIKERLDRFFTLVSVIENFPFMATYVVRQTNFDHDVIVLDTWGRKPKM